MKMAGRALNKAARRRNTPTRLVSQSARGRGRKSLRSSASSSGRTNQSDALNHQFKSHKAD